nr:hypothetical protein [Tanacetum cinerariifolium]
MGCFANRGKGKRKPNLGGRAAGMLNTRDKTRNLSLKDITDTRGLVPIQFELRDKQIVMPLGDYMSADVARSHDGDGGGEDRPLQTMYPAVAWVALLTEAKANESPIWAAGQRAG